MIGRKVSHYKIVDKIGSGGMGVVYRAEDTHLQRQVALKFLHPDLVRDERQKKRFLNEARAASGLDHPNICNIYEVVETPDGRLFISMAYYGGDSLRDRISKGRLTAQEAFQVGFSVAQGLAYAHRRGIIHRDIKPGNVMFSEDGFVKVVDFGLAKLAGASRITESGTRVGTVAYMSPQQASGAEVDCRTDIWSVGVMLYEMVTGELPFRGEIDQAIVYSILNQPHKPVSELNHNVPAACANIIDRCLAKDVEKRYQTTDELVADLVKLAKKMGWESTIAGATVAPVSDLSRGRKRKRRVRTAVGVVVIVVVVGIIGWRTFWGGVTSPYTTEVRLAVMPLENLTSADNGAFVDGLTDVMTQMFDDASREHESMWVVPCRLVTYARLPDVSGAKDAFGVNRIVTGNLQRFGDNHRLSLDLLDAGTLEPIRSAAVNFDLFSPSDLADSLWSKVLRLVGIDEDGLKEPAIYWPVNVEAIRAYVDGVGYMCRDRIDARIDDAVASLKRADSLAPGFAAGKSQLGLAYWEKHRRTEEENDYLERALGTLAAAVELDTSQVVLRLNAGEVYRRSGEADRAATEFQAALATDSGNPVACRELSRIYAGQNRIDEAEAVLREAIDRRADYFEGWRLLGTYFYRRNDHDNAIKSLDRTLDLSPNDAFALSTLGAVYHWLGQWSKARSLFEKSFRLLPNCENCLNVGALLYYEERYEDSAEYFEHSFEYCDSTDHEVWGNLATSLYWVDGERDNALRKYARAIVFAENSLQNIPDDPYTIAKLVDYYAMSGNRTKTFEAIDRAEPYINNDAYVMYSVGVAHELFGDRQSALRYLGDAVRHQFSIAFIKGTRELRDLVEDPIFKQMIADFERTERQPTSKQSE